ncbi:ATP-binding protein [Catenuloplanes sp. NPDC051500]|uniref:ATP-binding protein n=1 Tax=Catenuloplanes sp. NPDC051500 TaxID=3363959 RepID=UPI00378D70AE
MNNLATALDPWRRDMRALQTADYATSLAEVRRLADEAELAAIKARQTANRNLQYARRRPSRYANAAYRNLRPEQDPRGMISSWYDRGPRALLIAGPARTGKTTAAFAIANAAHTQNEWVMVYTAADLSAALKPDAEPLAFDYATTCPLLVLDDLGRERVTDWWLEQLQRIVDIRCANERRLIVTTNAAADAGAAYDALVARYGDPIVERLIDDGGVVVLDGPAVRRVVTEW